MSETTANNNDYYMSEEDINSLTHKQKAFCESFAATNQLQQSAIDAGYSPKSAATAASNLLKHPRVSRYVRYLQSKVVTKKIADAQEIQELLTEMSRGNVTDELVTPRGDKVRAQIHTRERIKAADLLAAIQGIKTDNIHLKADQVVQFADDLKPTESK